MYSISSSYFSCLLHSAKASSRKKKEVSPKIYSINCGGLPEKLRRTSARISSARFAILLTDSGSMAYLTAQQRNKSGSKNGVATPGGAASIASVLIDWL